MRDRQDGTTTLVSVTLAGSASQYPSHQPVISGDGRTVAFLTEAPHFEPPTNFAFGPLVRHLGAGTTTSMVDPCGPVIPGDFDLSDDGSRIAFIELTFDSAFTAVANAHVADTTTRALIAPIANFAIDIRIAAIPLVALSGDGTVFALEKNGANPDTEGRLEVGTTTGGVTTSIPIASTTDLALSDDGSILGSVTRAGDAAAALVWALPSGTAKIVSANAAGNATSLVQSAAFSGDGKWGAFASDDPSGVRGDARGVTQAYTRSVAQPSPPPG